MDRIGWMFVFGVSTILGTYLFTLQIGTRITHELLPEYDYIVVGAGSAGAVVAARLSEDPDKSVLLLEAGGDDSWSLLMAIPLFFFMAQHSEADWSFYVEPQKYSSRDLVNERPYWPRGKCLGGTSSINNNVYVRGSRHDFDGWAEQGCEGWSYKQVLPYFLKSEKMMDDSLVDSAYHSDQGELPVSKPKMSSISETFADAAKELGYESVDYNGKDSIGVSNLQITTGNGIRSSTSRSFLRPVMHRRNLHISIYSHVRKVVFEDKIATGVEMVKNGQTHVIKAREEVILCAGAVMSPQILMASGVGPRDHLEQAEIPVVSDLPVGDNLHDHLMVFLGTSTNSTDLFSPADISLPSVAKYLFYGTGWLAGSSVITDVGFFQLDDEMKKKKPGLPDIQIHLFASLLEYEPENTFHILDFKPHIKDMTLEAQKHLNGRQGFGLIVNIAQPRSRGVIRLNTSDPFGYPIIDPHYLEDPYDVSTFIKGIRLANQMWETKAMRAIDVDPHAAHRLHPVCSEAHVYDSDDYWECVVRQAATTVYHPTSTCKMGASDDPTAVVDPQLRVRGVQRLRVADASVMPSVTSGNTNAPTIMIGEKAADLIRGVDSLKHFREKIKDL